MDNPIIGYRLWAIEVENKAVSISTPFHKKILFLTKKLAQIKKKLYLCALVFAQTQENCLVKGEKHNEMTQPLHTISNTNMQAFGNTGGSSVSFAGGWSSLSVTKTTSFIAIQEETMSTVTYSPGTTYTPYNPSETTLYTLQPSGPRRSRGENPGGNAVGDQTQPIGDMLLPLLAMAAAYIIVKLFRNRKTSHTL